MLTGDIVNDRGEGSLLESERLRGCLAAVVLEESADIRASEAGVVERAAHADNRALALARCCSRGDVGSGNPINLRCIGVDGDRVGVAVGGYRIDPRRESLA